MKQEHPKPPRRLSCNAAEPGKDGLSNLLIIKIDADPEGKAAGPGKAQGPSAAHGN